MRTLIYTMQDWGKLWHRLSRDYTAMSIGKELKFEIRKETEVLAFDDAPGGYDRVTVVYIDFERDEDHTLFLLKYR